jgi:23S rRNA (pseudouridine1915-N3)-methyltransferase
MEIKLLLIGKTSMSFAGDGLQEFSKRISRYHKFSSEVLEISKKYKTAVAQVVKKEEANSILKKIVPSDFLVLLDENGKNHSSREFANWLQKQLNLSHKRIVFLVGGAFGFDEKIYARANYKLSLSKMTYSHQLIRVIFTEQLYRAFTIIRNEKYHND